jgi:hypothetical protein
MIRFAPGPLAYLAVFATLAATGCRLQHDPAKAVSIEVSGIASPTDQERAKQGIDRAQKQSKKWSDGSSNVMTWSEAGQQMKVEVTPVSDIDAFVKKIDFGEVTGVEGRTIKVAYRPAADNSSLTPDERFKILGEYESSLR